MKYSIITFGCRVNQADSFRIEEQLISAGGTGTSPQEADLVVVNTCSVTGAADQGARQVVRKVARENPAAKIVLTGCYATRRPDEGMGLPGVVQVIPNARKDTLVGELGLTTAERFGDGDGACGARIHPGLAGRTAYTLRVQTGCDEGCSYCIIPATRGPGRSKPIPEVLAEIARVARAGYRQVAITGVHLGSYGRDLADGTSLASLLRRIAREPSDVLFRISSLEPMDCSREIVELVAGSTCFAPHFHLPLQHANDEMLHAMRRPYTGTFYGELVDRLRRDIPHASIGSDVIVGFPGETDAAFAELEAYLRRSPLSHVHVFPYSDRPGTAAAALANRVHGVVVRERAAALRTISRELTRRFEAAQHGSIRPALTIEDGSLAVTDNYIKVRILPGRPRNEWIRLSLAMADDTMSATVVGDGWSHPGR